MPNITTIANIKANFLNITGSDLDTTLTAYLAQAEELASKIVGQPLVEQSVTRDWHNDMAGMSYFLPYIKNTIVLTSLQYRDLPDESFSTQSGAVLYKSGGLTRIYNPLGYSYGFYRANLVVGFTTATAPADLVAVISEMVMEMLKATSLAGGDSRFGVTSLAQGESDVTRTTIYANLRPRFEKMLAPWKVTAWQT